MKHAVRRFWSEFREKPDRGRGARHRDPHGDCGAARTLIAPQNPYESQASTLPMRGGHRVTSVQVVYVHWRWNGMRKAETFFRRSCMFAVYRWNGAAGRVDGIRGWDRAPGVLAGRIMAD